jgi:hypothetical protein
MGAEIREQAECEASGVRTIVSAALSGSNP